MTVQYIATINQSSINVFQFLCLFIYRPKLFGIFHKSRFDVTQRATWPTRTFPLLVYINCVLISFCQFEPLLRSRFDKNPRPPQWHCYSEALVYAVCNVTYIYTYIVYTVLDILNSSRVCFELWNMIRRANESRTS